MPGSFTMSIDEGMTPASSRLSQAAAWCERNQHSKRDTQRLEDVMAGCSCTEGSPPDVQQQPPGSPKLSQ